MSYITYDYWCKGCELGETKMLDREKEDKDDQSCVDCGTTMDRLFNCTIARVSYPDGTTNRWASAKEKRSLEKEAKSLKNAGNLQEYARVKREVKEVVRASKGDRQAVNICKVSAPEK